MKNYVIIGNGTAAVGCIEGIRSIDKEAEIIVVSKENRHVYCRPLISYYLEGKTDLERMKYRPDDFYTTNKCTVLFGKSAVSIDAAAKRILLDDSTELPYDTLCNATGSSPFVPAFEGLDSVKTRFSFVSLEDTLELEKAIETTSRVLIIGAGLIGLKCAEGLHNRVKSITVCDLSESVLSSILDKESAEKVEAHLKENGISFMLGNTVASFNGNTAIMKDGSRVEFDVLVTAVGVRANIALIKDAGGKYTRGIAIDSHMRTSIEGIYAAGDCTESMDISDNTVKIMALLPNAYMQGFCAGVNMAGGEKVFDNAIPMNAIGFFGLHIMTAGSKCTADNGEVFEEKTDNALKKLFFRDGRLTGFILVGNTDRAGIYTNIIRSQQIISDKKIQEWKFSPNLFAFSAEYRRNSLGGVV